MNINLTKKIFFLTISALLMATFCQAEIKKTTTEFYKTIRQNNIPSNNDEELILIDENGKKIALSELKGKVVFINLWATWCGPCVEEMPSISSLKKKFKDNKNIVFVLLNVEADFKKSKKFMKDKNHDLPIYIAGKTIPSKYFQEAIPTTLIFNKNGDLEAKIQGGRNFDDPEIYEALKVLTDQ